MAEGKKNKQLNRKRKGKRKSKWKTIIDNRRKKINNGMICKDKKNTEEREGGRERREKKRKHMKKISEGRVKIKVKEGETSHGRVGFAPGIRRELVRVREWACPGVGVGMGERAWVWVREQRCGREHECVPVWAWL